MNTQSGSKASTSSPAGSIRAAGFVRTACSRPTPGSSSIGQAISRKQSSTRPWTSWSRFYARTDQVPSGVRLLPRFRWALAPYDLTRGVTDRWLQGTKTIRTCFGCRSGWLWRQLPDKSALNRAGMDKGCRRCKHRKHCNQRHHHANNAPAAEGSHRLQNRSAPERT